MFQGENQDNLNLSFKAEGDLPSTSENEVDNALVEVTQENIEDN